jgi:hypothetical protein
MFIGYENAKSTTAINSGVFGIGSELFLIPYHIERQEEDSRDAQHRYFAD